jgi:hypothetical protein
MLPRFGVAALRRRQMLTLGELADEFTAQHVAEPSTVASLEFRLRYALDGPRDSEPSVRARLEARAVSRP